MTTNSKPLPYVLLLVSHPVQYFVPIYQNMARDSRVCFEVMYRTMVGLEAVYDESFGKEIKWDIPLLDGYSHFFLTKKVKLKGLELGVIYQLLSKKPDILHVQGYDHPTNILAIFVCKFILRIPVIIRSDTQLNYKNLNPGFLKRLVKKSIFKMVDRFAAIGQLNKKFYEFEGVPTKKIGFAPYCVDNKRFAGNDKELADVRHMTRNSLGIPDDAFVVLMVAKLIPIKRAGDVLEACINLSKNHPGLYLLIVGSGSEEKCLRALAASRSFRNVIFSGFQNQRGIPRFYQCADIAVLASSFEQWGLVVNEAMAAGLPVIVSDKVGAAPDLVTDKGTGIVYPCGSIPDLSTSIEKMVIDVNIRKKYAENAKRLISEWDVDICAKKMIDMSLMVLENS